MTLEKRAGRRDHKEFIKAVEKRNKKLGRVLTLDAVNSIEDRLEQDLVNLDEALAVSDRDVYQDLSKAFDLVNKALDLVVDAYKLLVADPMIDPE